MESVGINVIFDDMIIDHAHASLWKEALQGVEFMVVRLVAPVPVLRERNARRNNPPGLAENHIAMNELIASDLEIDSGSIRFEDAAETIAKVLANKTVNRIP